MDKEIRAIQSQIARENRTLSGYAAVFNSPAVIQDFNGRRFQEVIRPRAFRQGLDSAAALYNHDTNLVLGKVKSGTLKLWQDDKGLAFSLDVPDTQAGRDLVTLAERGDIEGCSFGFIAHKDRWTNQGDMPVRELLDLTLVEISPTPFPAYNRTSLNVRSQDKKKLLYMRIKIAEAF